MEGEGAAVGAPACATLALAGPAEASVGQFVVVDAVLVGTCADPLEVASADSVAGRVVLGMVACANRHPRLAPLVSEPRSYPRFHLAETCSPLETDHHRQQRQRHLLCEADRVGDLYRSSFWLLMASSVWAVARVGLSQRPRRFDPPCAGDHVSASVGGECRQGR